MKNIAVIGSGTMGNGIAHVFAMHGFETNLIDVKEEFLDKAIKVITNNLDRMVAKEKIKPDDKIKTLQLIHPTIGLKKGIENVDLVVEAINENHEMKQNIFLQLDKLCPEKTILASNTSSISITRIAGCTKRPEKVIGVHFMNPVPVMKLVEVIKGYSTSDEVAGRIMELVKKLDKVPVVVNDYPGFISNRILMPMINESVYALYEQVAGVEEIDTVMKLGMAHPMGPLQLADFIGLDVCLAIMNVLYEGFGNPKYAPCPLLVNMVHAGHLGVKSGRGFYSYQNKIKELVVSERFKN